MPKMHLRKVVVVDDKDGNPQGFGPGEADVPDWAIKALEAQGTDIKSLEAPKIASDAKKAASGSSSA